MIIINTPMKADLFQRQAEEAGLRLVSKAGMKMVFDNPEKNDREKAEELKKKFKENANLAAIFFQVTAD